METTTKKRWDNGKLFRRRRGDYGVPESVLYTQEKITSTFGFREPIMKPDRNGIFHATYKA